MIHLTLTGFDAGRPLCDCDKQAARDDGDEFVHAMYWNERQPGYERNRICCACLAAWDEE